MTKKVEPLTGQLAAKKVLYQQCPQGRDDTPDSTAHLAHVHQTKHGRSVVCRGWFPKISTMRSGITYRSTP